MEISIHKVRIDEIKSDGMKEEHVSESSKEKRVTKIFNLVKHIENETNLTKTTIFEILQKANNLNLLFKNPQQYTEKITSVIKECRKEFEVKNIQYFESEERFDIGLLREEMSGYEKYLVKVDRSIYDRVILDTGPGKEGVSRIERDFVKRLDGDTRIKLFIKLPDWYVIETPAGSYTPDWAIVVEKRENGQKREKVYFVVETKGTNNPDELRPEEQFKIQSAKKRFKLAKEPRFIAPIKDYESFEKEW